MQLFLDSILVGQSFGATLTETTVCKNGDKTEKFSHIAMYINVLPLIREQGSTRMQRFYRMCLICPFKAGIR
mgnify:CR=1 FL=1